MSKNRSMAAKADKARRQGALAFAQGKLESQKSCFASWRDGAGEGPASLAAMVAAFKGKVVRGSVAVARGLSRDIGNEGAQRRRRYVTSYGNGERTALRQTGLISASLLIL